MNRQQDPTGVSGHHVVLAVIAALLPLILVQLLPSTSPSSYSFQATITNHLGESANQQLLYYEARLAQGTSPADNVVVALDRNYTRGLGDKAPEPGSTHWFQGSLMTPEVFFGEQYLFFGMEQVYVSQVKSGTLWPDQVAELWILYLSPATTVLAPVQLPFLLQSDSLSARLLATLLARCALLITTVFCIVRRRRNSSSLARVLLTYAVVAMLITVPIIGHLY